MKRPILITGLDIGSSKISAVSAMVDEDGKLKFVTQANLPSKGVSRGVVEDLSEAVSTVTKVLDKLKEKAGSRLEPIFVNISGATIKGERSRGMIPLALRGREVTASDMDRCAEVASTVHLPIEREVVHRIVHRFSVDGESWIKNPAGLSASRLECEVFIVTANVNHIENIYKCVSNSGYETREVVFSGIADGLSVLDHGDMDAGVILLDIGASLTVVSAFFGGSLFDLSVVPVGTNDMKGDFKESTGFGDILLAITIKANELLKVGGVINSLTLTGGAAFADMIAESLEEKMQYPIKIGSARDIIGQISSADSMKAVSAIGLVKYGYEDYIKRYARKKGFAGAVKDKIVDLFNNYF